MNSPSLKTGPIDSARAQFIGLVLNWGFYGLLISQTFSYCATFAHDGRTNKVVAYSVFSLETLQTVLLTHDMYGKFVLNPGDVEFLGRVGLTWLTTPVLCGIVGWIAALFYANRIYKVSRSRKISGIIVLFSFLQLIAAITVGLQSRVAPSFIALRESSRHDMPPVLWSVIAITCDVTITVVMTYYLIRLRREFYQSSPLIRKLMMLTVETGMVTALATILSSMLFSTLPDSEAFNIPGFVLSKLYSNSLLRVLNSRNRTEYTREVVTLPVSNEL